MSAGSIVALLTTGKEFPEEICLGEETGTLGGVDRVARQTSVVHGVYNYRDTYFNLTLDSAPVAGHSEPGQGATRCLTVPTNSDSLRCKTQPRLLQIWAPRSARNTKTTALGLECLT